jgi:hypothetical protein
VQKSIDELLSSAYGQSRNVVDRFFRIELTALTAGMFERIDDVRTNAEQAELENLKQSARPRADDDDIRLNRAFDGAALCIGQLEIL